MRFLVILIRKLQFREKSQLWSMFDWVIEVRTFTVIAVLVAFDISFITQSFGSIIRNKFR
jgi:hypothetical protein